VIAPAERIGQVIGRQYRLDALIGRGAMADVYRALDLGSAGQVAVKVLRHNLDAQDPAARQRFQREAEVQALLRHRNVAALLATGVTDAEEPYLVVELLRGRSLRGALKASGRVEPWRAASYAYQALQGLAAVHAAGILHRDLKPANLMLEPSDTGVERVVLIDFGFATFEGSAALTQRGAVVGSLGYIAPERLRGEPVDDRSDLYSIGVIFHELLAGEPPFAGMNDFDLVDAQLNAEPPALPAPLDAVFGEVIARALAKRQDQRFASADAMAAALQLAATRLEACV
jgi:eukaryotic-like serine/threonine-protein kinase